LAGKVHRGHFVIDHRPGRLTHAQPDRERDNGRQQQARHRSDHRFQGHAMVVQSLRLPIEG
jgi:hypothetical protein